MYLLFFFIGTDDGPGTVFHIASEYLLYIPPINKYLLVIKQGYALKKYNS
jgi:hypothetical protein